MTDLSQDITDNSDLRRYFALIEHMAEDDLDLYEYRLLGHYKRVCGTHGGQCTESVRTTANRIKGMSIGKVSEARRELERLGWIKVAVHAHPSQKGNTVIDGISVTLVDRMAENVARYSAMCSANEHEGVHDMNTGVHQVKQRRTRSGRTKKTEPATSSGSPLSKFGYTVGDHSYWVEEEKRTHRTTIHEVTIVRFTKEMIEVTYHDNGEQHTVLRKPSSLSKTPPKLERKTTPLQDAIGKYVFSVPVDVPIGKLFAIKLRDYESEILTIYPKITPEHFRAAFAWKGEFKPGKVETIIKMLGDYRKYLAIQQKQPVITNGSAATRQALYGGEHE
jgi:hypothetical protein